MANICAICGKGSVKGGTRSFLRSHYNPTGSVRKHPNLQWGKLGNSLFDRTIGQIGRSALPFLLLLAVVLVAVTYGPLLGLVPAWRPVAGSS